MISTNVMCFPHHIIVELCIASMAIVNREESVKVYVTILLSLSLTDLPLQQVEEGLSSEGQIL